MGQLVEGILAISLFLKFNIYTKVLCFLLSKYYELHIYVYQVRDFGCYWIRRMFIIVFVYVFSKSEPCWGKLVYF